MEEEITEETITYLSKLSRICCTEEEIHDLASSIKKIIKHIEQLQKIDTQGFEPVTSVINPSSNIWRDDLPTRSSPRSEILQNAPEQIGGMIRIPKVFS